jgi:hypothetical protein
VFNNQNEVTHAVGALPDDYDTTVVHKRVNGEWVLEGTYSNAKGVSVPVRWHKTDPNKILYHRQPGCADHRLLLGRREDRQEGTHLPRSRAWTSTRSCSTTMDEAVAVKHNYDYPTYVVLKPDDPIVKRGRSWWRPSGRPDRDREGSTADGLEHVLSVHNDRDQASSTCGTSTTERSATCSIRGRR